MLRVVTRGKADPAAFFRLGETKEAPHPENIPDITDVRGGSLGEEGEMGSIFTKKTNRELRAMCGNEKRGVLRKRKIIVLDR